MRRTAASGNAVSQTLEVDTVFTDVDDLLVIFALGGNDRINVPRNVPIGGRVNGGAGIDTAVVPRSWTKVNTER